MTYKMLMMVMMSVVAALPAHAYRAGQVSAAMDNGRGGSVSQSLGYSGSGSARDINFFERGRHVTSFGRSTNVTPCINCKGARGIDYTIVYEERDPRPPMGNWMHGHNPNYRTSRR